jgi:hypothetical protein
MEVTPVLVSVSVADPPEKWEAVGFHVEGASCQVGEVRIDLGAAGSGIVACGLHGVEETPVDGLDIRPDSRPIGTGAAHANGTVALDHLVITSHDPQRTRLALEERGFDMRRTRQMGSRLYTFYRVGESILELVGPAVPDGEQPARFFGLAFTVADLDATAAHLGPSLGAVKDAVQPGRRIATLHRDAGLSVPVAFMSPGPGAI